MKEWAFNILCATVLIFAPIKSALLCAFGLAILDMVFGIIAAKRKGEKITSQGLRRTIAKLFVYELLIVLAFVTETFLTGDSVPLVRIFTGFVGITELKSVMENMERITGVPIIRLLINKLTNTEKQQ